MREKEVDGYDENSILDLSVFRKILNCKDFTERMQLTIRLSSIAKRLGVKTQFEKTLNAFMEEQKKTNSLLEHWTNFTDCPYGRMKCGQWIADDNGVCAYSLKSGEQNAIACNHPILPVRRMINLQTDEEQVTLAFKRNGKWKEITVPKTTIAKKSLITGLASKSVLVTDDNAQLLMRYLKDIESENEKEIEVVRSSSKMGWIGGVFLPYDKAIEFDGNAKFREIYGSIRAHGNRDVWYDHVKELRASGKFEINFLLAASFASVLMPVVGGLPFVVDLWGETEGGKTVALMVAASVWANPGKGMYIRDYASTDVGLEALADFLNHLPVILDDTSKRSRFIEQRFEEIVYALCSGKGKTRSNKDLGINRESTWENIVLTNGEKPLTSYVSQGGAYNRVLEVEAEEHIFQDPQRTADTVKANFGFAGRDFVEAVKKVGFAEIRDVQKEFQRQIYSDEKMQKQSISLSIIMTADKIATDYLFEDGRYISLEDAKRVLIDRDELSEGERCYNYILDKVAMNSARFSTSDANVEKWGVIENGYAVFFGQALEDLCQAGGFSKKSFLSWAGKNGMLLKDSSGKNTKPKMLGGRIQRCIFIKLREETELGEDPSGGSANDAQADADGFLTLDDSLQEELPFD